MTTTSVDNPLKEHPAAVTAILSVVGYTFITETFLGTVPGRVFPNLSLPQVNLLSDAIAVVNTMNVLVIVAGWRRIRRGEIRKHAAAMVMPSGLILVFLVMYLAKVNGGGAKEFVDPAFTYYPCLAMLAIHIILSIALMPVTLYALILGITHFKHELRTEMPHRKIGRVTAGAWLVSLALSVVTYLFLNHVYSQEYTVTTVKSMDALLAPVVGV